MIVRFMYDVNHVVQSFYAEFGNACVFVLSSEIMTCIDRRSQL